MNIVGDFFNEGLYIGIDFHPGDFVAGVRWAFFDTRWHVTFLAPFLCLHVKYDFEDKARNLRVAERREAVRKEEEEELAAVRSSLAHVPGVTRVFTAVFDSDDEDYIVEISEYDPDVTYAIAKRLAGKGLTYHVVLASAKTEAQS